MKIDALITCTGKNSRKFLQLTLPMNIKLFDNIYIITKEEDLKDNNFNKLISNVNYLISNSFSNGGAKFNRGAVLNEVIENINPTDWICHLDADIVVKDSFSYYKNNLNLDVNTFIGARRVIIPTLTDFKELINSKVSEGKFWCPSGSGWGYFQCWNVNSNVVKNGIKYPESFDSSIGDWQWRNYFSDVIENDTRYTGNYYELPITVLHLGSPNIEINQIFWNNE